MARSCAPTTPCASSIATTTTQKMRMRWRAATDDDVPQSSSRQARPPSFIATRGRPVATTTTTSMRTVVAKVPARKATTCSRVRTNHRRILHRDLAEFLAAMGKEVCRAATAEQVLSIKHKPNAKISIPKCALRERKHPRFNRETANTSLTHTRVIASCFCIVADCYTTVRLVYDEACSCTQLPAGVVFVFCVVLLFFILFVTVVRVR